MRGQSQSQQAWEQASARTNRCHHDGQAIIHTRSSSNRCCRTASILIQLRRPIALVTESLPDSMTAARTSMRSTTRVVACCSVLQRSAACCSVLQCVPCGATRTSMRSITRCWASLLTPARAQRMTLAQSTTSCRQYLGAFATGHCSARRDG